MSILMHIVVASQCSQCIVWEGVLIIGARLFVDEKDEKCQSVRDKPTFLASVRNALSCESVREALSMYLVRLPLK